MVAEQRVGELGRLVDPPQCRFQVLTRRLRCLLWVMLPPAAGVDTTRVHGRAVPVQGRGVFMVDEIRADVASEAGQTMAEYAVVLGVITIAVVVTLGLLSTAIKNLLSNVISVL
jgi:Flp pilus assembly pilin Flp